MFHEIETMPTSMGFFLPVTEPTELVSPQMGSRLPKDVWQLGLQLFAAAMDTTEVGLLVVAAKCNSREQSLTGFGCTELARRVQVLDETSSGTAGGEGGLPLLKWVNIVTPKPQFICARIVLGCKVMHSAQFTVYLGFSRTHAFTLLEMNKLQACSSKIAYALRGTVNTTQSQCVGIRGQSGIQTAAAQFGLTKAESTVLAALASGAPIKRIATSREVSVSTIKSQVKSIYGKLGIHRGAELHPMLQTLTALNY